MGIKKKQGHRCVADMMKSVFFVIDDCLLVGDISRNTRAFDKSREYKKTEL